MFALGPFAQKEHVPIVQISKSHSANEEESFPKSDKHFGLSVMADPSSEEASHVL
jgi:hypothetical protein